MNEKVSAACCRVCDYPKASNHYGSLCCVGCKSFFRRTIKFKHVYECIFSNKCVIKSGGFSMCRACRFNKCLAVGLDPKRLESGRGKSNKAQFDAKIKTKRFQQDARTDEIEIIDSTKEDHAIMLEKCGKNVIATGKTMYQASTNPLGAMNIVKKYDTFNASSIVKYFTCVEKLCDDYFDSNALDALFSPESEYMFSMNVSAKIALAEPRKISARTKIDWSNIFMVTPLLFHRRWCRVISWYIDWTSHIPELHQLSITDQVRLVMDRAVPCIDILMGYKAFEKRGMIFPDGAAYLPQEVSEKDSVAPSMTSLMKDFGNYVYDEFTEPAKRMNLTLEEFTLLKLLVFLTPVPGLSAEGTTIIKKAHKFYSEILKQQIRVNSPTMNEFFDRMCKVIHFLPVIEQSIAYCDKGFSVMSLFDIANMKGELPYEVHVRKGFLNVSE